MAGITTAMCASYKRDLMFGRHHQSQSRTFTATGTSTQTWTSVSALTGLAVGAFLSGTNVAAGTRIADILSSTSIFVSKASTGALGTVTAVGDTFKMALFKVGVAGTYGAASTAYADMTGNTDETSGTGYTAGGTALTNVDPVASPPSAYTDYNPDPSWTSASFSTIGCMIYNTTQNGDTANTAAGVYDDPFVPAKPSGTVAQTGTDSPSTSKTPF
jgi:hypothetical protein